MPLLFRVAGGTKEHHYMSVEDTLYSNSLCPRPRSLDKNQRSEKYKTTFLQEGTDFLPAFCS